jgi:mannose-1-phosphate guanylyltransferase/mannose-6-phosphate isomerase
MHLDKDSSDNSFLGNVVNIDSKNCYIASDSRLITAIDLQNLIIVDTKDALLISSLEGTKKIKSLVKKLRKSHKDEVDVHTEVLRPWGKFISLNKSKGFHLKKISVNSGASISLQKHIHRSEHWVVLSGIAEVTLAEKKFLLNENESTYIPKGAIHRLKNIGNDTLEIIEVQTGNYLGEDDIKRLEDDYERTLNS